MSTCLGCRHLAGKPETALSGVHVCVRTYPHQEVGRWGPGEHEDPRPVDPSGNCYVGGYVFKLPDDPVVKRRPVIDRERG